MVGRQFSYYCLPEDLDEIQDHVLAPMSGRLVVAEKIDRAHKLVPVERLALDRARMGQESLSLLLLPPEPMSNLVFSGPWIDDYESHLIQVGRCYTDGRVLRIARFWYVPCVFRVDRWQTKPEDFVSWCQAVFRKTKALLQRQPNSHYRTPIKEWFGKQAWAEVSAGRLKAVPD